SPVVAEPNGRAAGAEAARQNGRAAAVAATIATVLATASSFRRDTTLVCNASMYFCVFAAKVSSASAFLVIASALVRAESCSSATEAGRFRPSAGFFEK